MLQIKYFIHIVLTLIILTNNILIGDNQMDKEKTAIFTSKSFDNEGNIPSKYTCDGEDLSPELNWKFNNKDIGGYVLIVDDPDAQKVVGHTFVHWIVLLSSTINNLSEGISGKISKVPRLNSFAKELKNSFEKTNYGGPCPPAQSGEHNYRFNLFAIKNKIENFKIDEKLSAPFTSDDFKQAFSDIIIAQAQIVGKYVRAK